MYVQTSFSSYATARPTSRKRHVLYINPVRFTFVLLVVSLLFAMAAVISANSGDSAVESKVNVKASAHSIVVEQGDTLWSIAAANKPGKQDIRAYIEEIKSLNKLQASSLKQNQVLLLP